MRIARFASVLGVIHVALLASLTLGTQPTILSDSPMRFHSYRPQRQVAISTQGISAEARNHLSSMSNEEYATETYNRAMNYYQSLKKSNRLDRDGLAKQGDQHASLVMNELRESTAEKCWYSLQRPFYNVFPVVCDMVTGVKLSVTFDQVQLPFPAMLFQFAESSPPALPVGRITLRLRSVLWYSGQDVLSPNPSDRCWICIPEFEGDVVPCLAVYFGDETLEVESALLQCFETGQREVAERIRIEGYDTELAMIDAIINQTRGTGPGGATTNYNEVFDWCFRLLVLTSLLAAGNDLVTPVLLAKDQDAMGSVSPEETEKWIEMRARKARQRGLLGFEVGRALQEEKDRSPHFRNSHLALFHTGPGRKQPRVQLRRGSVVISKALTKVPTGFLGPETPEEIASCDQVNVREPMSVRTRFFILKRDDYRCKICGASPKTDTTTQLHIDHKMAVAAGGSSDISNLWVLCSRCNLGKGVEPL